MTVHVFIESADTTLINHRDVCDFSSNDSELLAILGHQDVVITEPDATGMSSSANQDLSIPPEDFSAASDPFMVGQMRGAALQSVSQIFNPLLSTMVRFCGTHLPSS